MLIKSNTSLAIVLILYAIFCCFCMYYCVIADPENSSIAKFIQVTTPTILWNRLHRTFGNDKMNILQHILDRMLVLVYFVVVGGCWSIVFWYLYPWLYYESSDDVSKLHGIFGVIVFVTCFISWAVANSSHPGKITAQNFPRYDHYPYDNLLFLPNQRCETTHLIKIPRSKFDRIKYHQMIPRYDHYCGWTHNTYGEENYRYFLMFLSLHVFMCFYGSYCALILFWDEVSQKKLFEITFFDRATGETVHSDIFIVGQYLFARRTLECCVLVIMFVMGIALSGFLGYHIYITTMGQTTNENTKWSDVKHWYKKEQKRYAKAVKDGILKQGESKISSVVSNDSPSIEAPTPDDGDVTCTPGPSSSSSSKETKPQSATTSTSLDNQYEEEYFDPGPVPSNVYNRGWKENWSEVFYPMSKRKDAASLGGYSRSTRPQKQKQQKNQQEQPLKQRHTSSRKPKETSAAASPPEATTSTANVSKSKTKSI